MSVKLSARRLLFCTEYLKDFIATKAYIRAGYSPKGAKQGAFRLLTNIDLQQKLAELTQKQCEKAEIDIQWIIQELKQLYERCQSSLSSKGAIAGATRQLELLGKHLGMFIDRSELTINIKEFKTIIIQIQTIISRHITDPNIKNRIAKDLQDIGL